MQWKVNKKIGDGPYFLINYNSNKIIIGVACHIISHDENSFAHKATSGELLSLSSSYTLGYLAILVIRSSQWS